METEIWKPVAGYEGLYEVSNFGNVKSLNFKSTGKEGILKLTISKNGYHVVGLTKNFVTIQFKVHRLVGQAFLGLEINNFNMFVCHKDDIRNNNNVNNLFIGTAKDNIDDKISKGRQVHGEHVNTAILNEDNVRDIREMLKNNIKNVKIARMYGVSKCTISDIKYYRSWRWI